MKKITTLGVLCALAFALPAPAATVVNNGTGTGLVSATGAIVGYGVVSTNTTNPVVIVWYGQNDGNSNAAWWTSSTNLGAKAVGTNTVTLTNLTSGRFYYYRAGGYEGTNATNWATSTLSFWTIAGVPTNLGATVYRPVMVNTNSALVAPTNFWTINNVGIMGASAGNVPRWFEAPTNEYSFPYYTDDGDAGSLQPNQYFPWSWIASSNGTGTNTTLTGTTSNTGNLVVGGQINNNADTSAWHYVTFPLDVEAALGSPDGLSLLAGPSTNAMGPFGYYGHQLFNTGFRTSVLTRVYSTLNTNMTLFVFTYNAASTAYSTTQKLSSVNQTRVDGGGWPPIRVWDLAVGITEFERIYVQVATTNVTSDYAPWCTIQMKGKP